MRSGRIQFGVVAFAVTAALVLGACGSDKKEDTTSTTAKGSDTTVTTVASDAETVAFDKTEQADLKKVGCYTGAVDGIIGAETDKAILAFQKAEGLETDGELGPETATALTAAAKSGKTVCAANSNTTVAPSTTTTAATGDAPCTAAAVSSVLTKDDKLVSYVCSEGYAGITFEGPEKNLGSYVLKSEGTKWAIDNNVCGSASAGISPEVLSLGCAASAS